MGLPIARQTAQATAPGRDKALNGAVLVAKVLAGTAALAVSAKVQVPFWPVPMTLQTLVVLLLGAGLGTRLGTLTVLAYLVEGAAGLPVFAGSAAGFAYLVGPTAGYLVGFVPAAAAAGLLAERGWARTLPRAAVLMLVGHALVFLPGLAWLMGFVGFDRAMAMGLIPFVAGTVVKSGLGAALLRARRPALN